MSNREQLQLAHTSTAALRQVILFPDRRTTLASFFRRRSFLLRRKMKWQKWIRSSIFA
jgi:hypothetical protein